jgi:predicted SAM-dependent methyltransferase
LDIGCGWGALLDCAQEQGFKPKGIELTLDSIDFAVMALGIPVSNNQFTDSRIGKESCTVISMAHVLEHIPNPKETMQKIYDTLEDGGIFCGIVPNIESFSSEKLKEDWVWLDPNYHYVHYSQATLKDKLQEAGFTIERMYTAVGDYGYHNFLDSLKTELTFENEDDIHLKIKELENKGKGEEIRFFARKLK